MSPKYSVKVCAQGILSQWSLMDQTVRVAIVAENSPDLILVRGAVPAGMSLAGIQAMIDQAKAGERRHTAGLKGGLS